MSFPSYPSYKDSGVEWLGEIPAHWEVKPLKRLAQVDNSGAYGADPEDERNLRPVATTAQISPDGSFQVAQMPERAFSDSELERYQCAEGDVLVVKSSGSSENIISGKTGIVKHDSPAFVFSNFLMRLRSFRSQCDPGFLYSLLKSHLTRERVKQMCSTTTYPNLQVGLYVSAKLPKPPLEEQEQINAFLDHETARIDALIEEQKRLIELLKEKRQAVISHAVIKGLDPDVPMKDSGVEWLGEVPAHWGVGPLRWYATVQGGVAKGKRYESGVETVERPFLRVANVQDGHVDLSDIHTIEIAASEADRYTLRAGDVLMNEGGDNDKLGRGTVWNGEIDGCLHQNHVFAIRPNARLLPNWLATFTRSTSARSYFYLYSKQSTNLASVSSSNVMSCPLPIPPRQEQEQILGEVDDILNGVNSLMEAVNSAMELLGERRAALISAAATGKIDVRDWRPPSSEAFPEVASEGPTA